MISEIIFILILAWLSWSWPRWTTLAIVCLAPVYIVSREIMGVPFTLPEIATGILLVATFARGFKPTISRLDAYPLIAIGAIGLGLGIGLWQSDNLWSALGIIKGWFIFPGIFAGLLVWHWRRSDPAPLAIALITSSLGLSVLAGWQIITHNFLSFDGRASAWFGSPNHLALYLVPCLIVGIALVASSQLSRLTRTTIGLITFIGLAALWGSFSYAGWIAFVSGVVILLSQPLTRRLSSLFLGLGAIGFIHQLVVSDRLQALLVMAADTSLAIRQQVWQTALSLGAEHWFLGLGLTNFPAAYASRVPQLFPAPLEYVIYHAHNFWLHTWLILGLPGVIGFGSLVIWHIQNIFRSQHFLKVGLLATTLSWLIHGLVDLPYFKYDLAFLFWTMIALGYLISHRHDYTKNL